MQTMIRHSTTVTGDAEPAELNVFSDLYETLRSYWDHLRGKNPEWVLACVEAAAGFTQGHHPGRFADGALDNTVLDLGRELGGIDPSMRPRVPEHRGKRRVLHVTTTVFGVGGHTRTIKHWIHLDRSSQHLLVLTNQADQPIPSWLTYVFVGGNELITLPHELDRRARAKILRSIACDFADLVVLHHFGNDTIPGLAFALEGGPPVAVLNHADHQFWMGSSIADGAIHQREASQRLSERRYIDREVVLPIPLATPDVLSRESARCSLGVPPDQLILLTIGRAEKFRPTSTHNFFQAALQVLEQIPDVHLYVIGLDKQALQYYLGPASHPRIHPCGGLEDPSLYQAATDIFLEPFPFGSATALLETALRGIPVVLSFDPLDELLVTNHGLNHLVQNPANLQEYIHVIRELVADKVARETLGRQLREHVLTHHTAEHWLDSLDRVYGEVGNWVHRPSPIPISPCQQSDIDLALAVWHPFTAGFEDVATLRYHTLVGSAYHARQGGKYLASLRLLISLIQENGIEPRFLKALAKLPLHWIARRASPLSASVF